MADQGSVRPSQQGNEPIPQDQGNPPEGPGTTAEGAQPQPYLGNWKTREAAEEGLTNLQKLLDQQGNELGTLRKQTDFFQRTIEDMKAQGGKGGKEPASKKAQEPDFDTALGSIQQEMEKLDPDEPDYHKQMSSLIAKSNRMAAQQATQAALTAAQAEFKKVLDERDTQAVHKNFLKSNPEFNSPDMQMRIQERLSMDDTGMSDPLVAFREIQRDDAMTKAQQLESELAEAKRLLSLKEGEAQTGKVIGKGQSPPQKTKPPKATGADLDRGMFEALQRAKGAA